MKINIATERKRSSWVLRMMAERWAHHLPDCTITTRSPDSKADINFYVNWSLYRKPTNIDVGLFTHRGHKDEGKDGWPHKKQFDKTKHAIDFCVAMSDNTLKLLPPEKSAVVKHGIGKQYKALKTKIVFGVVGRNYPSGRKGFNLIKELDTIPHAQFVTTDGKIKDHKMPAFYKSIDYLLILSNNEGGPVTVLEAMSLGKGVIAPDVGYCWEYPVIKYKDINELKGIISALCSQADHEKVWRDSAAHLLDIFNSLV